MKRLIVLALTLSMALPANASNLCYYVLFDNGDKQAYRTPPVNISGSISDSLSRWRPRKGIRPVHMVITPDSLCNSGGEVLATETVSPFAGLARGP